MLRHLAIKAVSFSATKYVINLRRQMRLIHHVMLRPVNACRAINGGCDPEKFERKKVSDSLSYEQLLSI
jgi:hypothetical protein